MKKKMKAPCYKKGGKIKKYDTGGEVSIETLEEQKAALKKNELVFGAGVATDLLGYGLRQSKNTDVAIAGEALGGAAQGAMAGAAFGPWGMAIGGTAGLIKGFVSGNKKKKQIEEIEKQERELKKLQNISIAAQTINQGSYAEGGTIKGKGTTKSDSINAKMKKGTFIVPAENAPLAEMLRKNFLSDKSGIAELEQKGGVNIKVSNKEHAFTPAEVTTLLKKGINLNALAPMASNDKKLAKGGYVTDEDLRDINIQNYLKGLVHLEADPTNLLSGKNPKSSATGKYQFVKATRDLILKKYGYDAWSKDSVEQDKAAIALIKDRKAVAAIQKGDFYSADEVLKSEWPSLPGGTQMSKKVDTLDNVRNTSPLSKAQLTKLKGYISNRKKGDGFAPVPNQYDRAVLSLLAIKQKTNDPKEVDKAIESLNPKLLRNKPIGHVNLPMVTVKGLKPDYTPIALKNGIENQVDLKLATINEPNTSIENVPLNSNTSLSTSGNDYSNNLSLKPMSRQGAIDFFPNSGNNNDSSNVGKLETGLAIAQMGMGLGYTLFSKRPKFEMSPEILDRYKKSLVDEEQAKIDAGTGFSMPEFTSAQNELETLRRTENSEIDKSFGTNTGSALSAKRITSINKAKGIVDLAAADAILRLSKRQFITQAAARADNLANAVAGQEQLAYEADMLKYNQNQEAGSALLNAGISNFFEGRHYRNLLTRLK